MSTTGMIDQIRKLDDFYRFTNFSGHTHDQLKAVLERAKEAAGSGIRQVRQKAVYEHAMA